MSKRAVISARVPAGLDEAIRAIAIRSGITRAEAIEQLLLRGLETEAGRPEPATPVSTPTPTEVVFPSRLALLLIETAALATLIAKRLEVDRSQLDSLRKIYRAEYLQ